MFGSTYIQFGEALSSNMCKVDHQALSYVKVLSETHLLPYSAYILTKSHISLVHKSYCPSGCLAKT